MNNKIATVEVAETKININLLFEETGPRFGAFLKDFDPTAPYTGLSEEELDAAVPKYPDFVSKPTIEFNELMFKVCRILLDKGMPTFHGTAFIWNEKAWIFTAPSGTGKSTQYFMWKALFNDEIRLLSGDKTVLRCEDDGSVTVFPSPWAGKEGMNRMESAPLEGIIYLAQDSKNIIAPFDVKDVPTLFPRQFIYPKPTYEQKLILDRTLRTMLRDSSVWHFRNKGDMASAKLAHDTILKSK